MIVLMRRELVDSATSPAISQGINPLCNKFAARPPE